ncbi:hypothetical protein PEX1_101240 [Penicillium expansum]|uniref:Uncharacterized protein n=1 Tax=Penicillium expansum TaxID=27334 RepID=A0A0A2JVN3_PENEN|nr:hypothetical protein PEX2_094540 [Penicillium expansum]KGO37462.1 hypothetical protein PEXP_004350 [Penicillium expansum]KGO50988.1 hypothetical protein PEX2_094540 [Penicillium expansum]KGO58673.1 hypothetical protein PEX1_101240 [Penicillium expansum]
MSLFDISTLLCAYGITLYEIQKRNECSEIVRYVGIFRPAGTSKPNANNNLTFEQMHEPIYGYLSTRISPKTLDAGKTLKV